VGGVPSPIGALAIIGSLPSPIAYLPTTPAFVPPYLPPIVPIAFPGTNGILPSTSVPGATPLPTIALHPNIPTTPIIPAPDLNVLVISPRRAAALVSELGVPRNTREEMKNMSRIQADARALGIRITEDQTISLVNFVTYGTSAFTRTIGGSDRRSIVRDALDTLRTGNIDPADLERMAQGQLPHAKNLKQQKAYANRVKLTMKTIFGHNPNLKNPTELKAFNTLTYRLYTFPRDLKKESLGLARYKKLFKKNPDSSFGWAAVRVLGYVKGK
jgi:hypothetical protein